MRRLRGLRIGRSNIGGPLRKLHWRSFNARRMANENEASVEHNKVIGDVAGSLLRFPEVFRRCDPNVVLQRGSMVRS